MKLQAVLEFGLLALALPAATAAAAGWGFGDATVSVQAKGAGVGGGVKEKLAEGKVLSKTLALGGPDTLKLLLTTRQDGKPKVAHQVFLLLKDKQSGLDISYPLSTKDNGKAKLDLKQKDLPVQLLRAAKPLDASIVIASFGAAKGYSSPAFKLRIELDPTEPLPGSSSRAVRYGRRDEIHHIFRPDPKSPPVIVSLFFAAAVLAALPVLGALWLFLGANVNHLSISMGNSPVSHMLFLGSIVGLEGIFFLYYTSWSLFQLLPAVAVVGTVTFLSGTRALGEVQERRLAGLR